MAIDQALIGQMAASLMEEIEKGYGEDATVKAAALVVAVEHRDGKIVHLSFGPGLSTQRAVDLLEEVVDARPTEGHGSFEHSSSAE